MAFEELKKRHAAVWSSAPFEKVAVTIEDVHDDLVERLGVTPGERWLDVACGTGAVASRAARRGALVTGVDIAPTLVDTARRQAAEQGLELVFDVGDAEALPYPTASFDTVTSTFGVMFAPDHGAVARELARVVRPGGRVALAAWDPEHGVRDLFRMMRDFQPAPPEGAGNPFAWGDTDHVKALLGGDFELRFDTRVSTHTGNSGEEIWTMMVTGYGPTKMLADSLSEERRAALRQVWLDFYAGYRMPDGTVSHPRPYLITVGTRR
jgi:SAM-dependent methyltransferase